MELLLGQCAKERAGPDQATADGDAAARSFGVDPDGNPRRQAPQKRWCVGDQVAIGQDIYESGRHLLSLINDILDLSKIEAGRMKLELTAFDLPTAIDSALTLVRERATRRGIALEKTLDERVGQVQADERKIR